MKLEKQTIDFNIYKKFNLNSGLDIFVKYKFLLINEKALYITIACENLNFKLPKLIQEQFKKPFKIKIINTNELNFELNLLKIKIKMFNFYKQAIVNASNKEANASYISKFCDEMLSLGVDKNASDIHIENSLKYLKIRFRINGSLKTFFNYPSKLHPMLSSILKLLSSLDISVNRLPQNGQFSKKLHNQSCDFRLSTLPTTYGESLVIRILGQQQQGQTIEHLNLDINTTKSILENMKKTRGLVLITGSTGSGKTTTLYAMLNSLKSLNTKIISIEEPVEYNLNFISQVNINNDIGLTYEKVLVNVLRQDPDILMIGEIRDEVALNVALRASLTGHLVLASLHTNDALQTITRLLNLKAQPFILASVLSLIVSQALIKILCKNCKQKIIYKNINVYAPKGCIKCNLSGYYKRVVISEFLNIDSVISKMIQDNLPISKIEQYAKTKGYKSLKDSVYEKFIQGETSLEEYGSYLFT
jgi:general secretion pathway protein E